MKLQELLEGKVKNAAIDREYDRHNSRTKATFGVMVNGKVWKRNGVAISFADYAAAKSAANKITASKNITTQVIPLS